MQALAVETGSVVRLIGVQQVELARQADPPGAPVTEGLHTPVVIPRAYSACRWVTNAAPDRWTSARCSPADPPS